MEEKLTTVTVHPSSWAAVIGIFLFTVLTISREGMETALMLLQVRTPRMIWGALIGLVALPSALLIVLTGVSGFAVGTTYPSRDMLVRAVTPPGAYGRVFGFVSTGFNIGASIAPIVYGMLMDHGQPRGIFLLSAAVSLICVSTVTFGFSGREKE